MVADVVPRVVVSASVPRLRERHEATSEWPTVPVPRWSEPAADQAGHTRRRLLLAAAHRFAAQGYYGTSLSDILAEAGGERGERLSKGALYFHFGSKYGLARSVVEETRASWAEVVAAVSARHHDPLRAVLAVVDAAVATSLYDPLATAGRRICLDCVGRDSPPLPDLSDLFEPGHVVTLLTAAGEQKLLRPGVDAARTADHIYTTMAGHLALSRIVPARGTDVWAGMSSSWQALLPSVATDPWLARWRSSGWLSRARPRSEDYRDARAGAAPG